MQKREGNWTSVMSLSYRSVPLQRCGGRTDGADLQLEVGQSDESFQLEDLWCCESVDWW